MDSNDLEKERGITILAKCTSVEWEHDGTTTHINIVDTPGHADFGAEVERILSMVDGVILLVDAGRRADAADQVRHRQGAQPGPEADRGRQQDRPPGRAPAEVLDECFELFLSLDAMTSSSISPSSTPPAATAMRRDGRRALRRSDADVPEDRRPRARAGLDPTAEFSMLATCSTATSSWAASSPAGSKAAAARQHADHRDRCRRQSGRGPAAPPRCSPSAASSAFPSRPREAGDIVAIAGLTKATVSNTIAEPSVSEPLHARPIDPPDAGDELRRQRQPLCRPRRRQGPEPRHP
jgi:GTP-binding protein